MKIRVAKKILKNKDILNYTTAQIKQAEIVVKNYQANAPKEEVAE